MTADDADLNPNIVGHFAPDPPAKLGVAVSGGGDSVALLVLLSEWAAADLHVVTVDHGLRAEAADEARMVAQLCHDLGVSHDILKWQGADSSGNLMDQARRARYRLMSEWARARGIGDVALGHTRDDLAETFLIRLARGAGLDGLSAMSARRQHGGVVFHRPLLGVSRAALRDVLQARGAGWAEDPTNDNPAFDRARARLVLETLEPLGVTTDGLAHVAQTLRDAREALEQVSLQVARPHVRFDAGDVLVARDVLMDQPKEVARRLLQAAFLWVAGPGYPPRGAAQMRVLEAVAAGDEMTLQGCRMLHRRGDIRVCREWKAVADQRSAPGDVWDGRWVLDGPEDDVHVAALGETGLEHCPDRKATGRPAASLMASPAVWRGDRLIAAPLAGLANGWSVRLVRASEAFFTGLGES